MPIWLRSFHIKKISDFNKKENEKIEKAQKGQSNQSSVLGPNINPNPSSIYNFKK
tara:strand:+ start:251 stop:415 length:165 start_codon:yes stop_codon:yes gene_type:complete